MQVFITGASGYIGGSIAAALMSRGHTIRGLVRSDEKAELVSSIGILPVVGDLDDTDLLVSEAGRADIIVNAASTLHLAAAKSLVRGAQPGKCRLLHTSGIGLVSVDVAGMEAPTTVVDDDNEITPGAHPMQHTLRSVEDVFLSGLGAEKRCTVISNALIYGSGSGLGRESIQIPLMARAAHKHGFVSVVGLGLNRWSVVHIDDVVDLYLKAIDDPSACGFYFCEAENTSFGEIGAAIGKRLHLPVRLQPLSEASEIYGEMFARYLLGTNSVVRGQRARRELNWSPSRVPVLQWTENEFPAPSEEKRA